MATWVRRQSPDLGGILLYALATPICLGVSIVPPPSGLWSMQGSQSGVTFSNLTPWPQSSQLSSLSSDASFSRTPSLTPAGSVGAPSACPLGLRGPHCNLCHIGLELWVCRLGLQLWAYILNSPGSGTVDPSCVHSALLELREGVSLGFLNEGTNE